MLISSAVALTAQRLLSEDKWMDTAEARWRTSLRYPSLAGATPS